MILQEISVSGWRSFAEKCRVGPFETGLNVLHAPNGSGKSTLFEALRLAIFDSHQVGGQEIKNILPWGRGLTPEVCIRFEEDGVEFELQKQFINSPSAQLLRKESGKYVPLKSGREADNYLRDLFAGAAPGKGLSKPTHWGLAQILWTPQGQLRLETLSADLVGQVQDILGNERISGRSGKLEQAIDALYAQYYTKSGKLKTGQNAAELLRLQAERDQVKEAHAEAQGALDDFENTSRKIEDLQSTFDQFQDQMQALAQRKRQLQEAAKQFSALQNEAASLEKDAAAAMSAYEKWDKFLKDRQKQLQALERLQTEQDTLHIQQEQAEALLTERKEAHKTAETAYKAIRKEDTQIGNAQRMAEQARRYVENTHRLALLRTRLAQLQQAREELEAARKERTAVVAPSEDTLADLRNAQKALEQCRIRLEALLITLEITPLQALQARDILGAAQEDTDLQPGAPLTLRGEQQVSLRLEGIADIRASGPVVDTESLREELDRLERQIADIRQPYGDLSLEELEVLHRQATALEGTVREAAAKLDSYLDKDDPEEMAQDVARCEAELTQLLRQHPDWELSPPEPDTLEADAEQARLSYRERLLKAEDQELATRNALDSAKEQAQELRLRLETCTSQATGIAEEIRMEEKRGNTLDALETHRQEAAMQHHAAQGTLEMKAAALADFEGNPQEDLHALERQLTGIETEANNNRDKLQQEKGRMTHLIDAKVYSRVTELEERLAVLDEAIARESENMEAIRLLKECKDQISSDRMLSIVAPVATVAGRMLERVAGGRLGTVHLDDSFVPKGVHPRIHAGGNGDATPVDLDNLSGGEQEQLHFVTRLALAETLAREQRQLVVMDDVLTATDTGRLGRVLNLLEEAAEHLQIIVLTCHPERYRSLRQSQFLDLEAIKITN